MSSDEQAEQIRLLENKILILENQNNQYRDRINSITLNPEIALMALHPNAEVSRVFMNILSILGPGLGGKGGDAFSGEVIGQGGFGGNGGGGGGMAMGNQAAGGGSGGSGSGASGGKGARITQNGTEGGDGGNAGQYGAAGSGGGAAINGIAGGGGSTALPSPSPLPVPSLNKNGSFLRKIIDANKAKIMEAPALITIGIVIGLIASIITSLVRSYFNI